MEVSRRSSDRNGGGGVVEVLGTEERQEGGEAAGAVKGLTKPLYLFEHCLRAVMVHLPRLLNESLPFNRCTTLIFMYTILQVMALLWAFLLSAAFTVVMELSALGAKRALGGEGDGSLASTSFEDVSMAQAFATFYVVYSTFRVFARFGKALGVIAWESVDDFPQVRKVTAGAAEAWPHFIELVFLPHVVLAVVLLATPPLCASVEPIALSGPFRLSVVDIWGEGPVGYWRNWCCTATPVLYLTPEYPKVRRTLKLVLVVGLLQFGQLILHRFPSWRADLSHGRFHRGKRTTLHFLLLGCLCLTGAWLVRWLGVHFGVNLLDRGPLRDYREFGLWLLFAWTLWTVAVSHALCTHARSPPLTEAGLRVPMQDLKTSFVVACGLFFVRGCFHPEMGFLDAQAELTVLSIVIPIVYTLLYLVINTAMRLNRGLVLVGAPVAATAATIICQFSGFGGPATVFIVALHMLGKLVQFFGTDGHLHDDDDDEATKVTDERGEERDAQMSLDLDPEPDSSPKGEGGGGAQPPPTVPVSSPQLPQWGGSDYGGSSSVRPRLRKVISNLEGFPAAACGLPKSYSMSDLASATRSQRQQRQEESDREQRLLLAPPPAPRWRRQGKEQEQPSPSRPPYGAAWVVGSMASDTNVQFLYRGTIQLMVALLVILSLFVAAFQVLSYAQEHRQWYPSFIESSITPDGRIVVEHALIAKMSLQMGGGAQPSPPRYATCDFTWHGLTLVDYALIAELAYFGVSSSNKDTAASTVLDQFFPAAPGRGRRDRGPAPELPPLKFELRVPSESYLRRTHAQFVELVEPSLNLSVVAIRGTDVGRISDLMEDIKMWVEPIVFMLLSTIFPTIRIWPDSTASAVIEWLHGTLQLFGLQSITAVAYYKPVAEYVRAIKEQGREVVLTGHSLGGGLARVVGSLEMVTSICFSPPGIAQSYRKFHIGLEQRSRLHHSSISVIPEYDFVPMIDTQVGLVQRIGCVDSAKALQNACHMLEGTICELVNHCGDPRGRFSSCQFDYSLASVANQVVRVLEERVSWTASLAALILIAVTMILLPVA